MDLSTLQWIVLVIHTVIALGIVVLVLMQADKGEGLSGAFGGGAAQTMFGAKGSLDFFGKLTTVLAVIFIITSITLTYMSGRMSKSGPQINTPSGTQEPAE